jgi:sortase A
MRLKNLVFILAALAIVVGLAACGSSTQAPKKMPDEARDKQVAPKKGSEESDKQAQMVVKAPGDKTLKLTIPKMQRIKDRRIPTGAGTDEALLKDNAAIHLTGTGYPWEKTANVYIAGHRLGYSGTGSYLSFYDIDKLQNGDDIYLTDANGEKYTYKVFDVIVVDPTDLHVLNPVKGKNIVSLQACTLPDYSKRIIVQGELEGIKKS